MKVDYLYESKTVEEGMKAAKEMTKAEKEKMKKIEKELEKLNDLLHKGEVKFRYKKKDGSIRDATGTLKTDLIPKDEREDKRRYTKSDEVFYYYDIDSEGFRAFRRENFKEIVNG